jgi:hypothetical protein
MSDAPSGVALTPERPWLGLRAFSEATRGYFFGRDAEIADLYERVVHRPLTICYGQSGQGKTSLMNAGLVPRLRETAWLPVPVRIAWSDDDPDVETQVLAELRKALRAVPLPKWRSLADFPDDVSLWELLHDPRHRLVYGSPEASPWRLVFLFDQFEEIFTLGERHRARADAWRDALGDLVENRLPSSARTLFQRDTALLDRFDLRAFHIRFVLTLRHDYLHALERWRRYIPSLLDNRFELKALNGKQAFEAVVYPGRLRSSDNPIVDAATGAAIVRFVASAPPEKPLVEIEAVPPLLSLICAELNAQRLALDGSHIYFDPFFGEPPALRKFIENIPTNADGVREPIARSVAERDLVSGGLTPEQVKESLERLIDKGLLQPEGKGESERLNLSAELMKFAGRGGTDILQAFYAGCFTGLPGTVRLWAEDTLLSPEGFRQTLNYDTALAGLRGVLAATGEAERALDQLITSRLLIAEEHGAVRRVELTHDILAPIVRESRERRKQVEARERAQPERLQPRAIRGGARWTRRGADFERFWEQLIYSIERRIVVPVIGSNAIVVEPDGQPFEWVLAKRMALAMGLTFSEAVPTTLDGLMLAARSRDVDRSQINRAMRHAVREIEGTARSRTAHALAAMDAWDTFILTSTDSLVETSLRQLRPQPVVLDLTAEADDQLRALKPDTTKVVYLAGRVGMSLEVPCTTGEILEFWLNAGERAPLTLDWLRSSLKNRMLLFLGIDWTNQSAQLLPWLLRGATRRFGLASFVDASRNSPVTDVMVLDHEGGIEWFDQPAALFVEELARRIQAIGPAVPEPAPAPMASSQKYNVFVSYAREDLPTAERIVRQLQEAGVDVWFDRDQLVAGDSFIQATRKAIDDCALFVSLISKASEGRQKEALFRRERELAAERAQVMRGSFYIPLVMDNLNPPFKAEPGFVNGLFFFRTGEAGLAPEALSRLVELSREAQRRAAR